MSLSQRFDTIFRGTLRSSNSSPAWIMVIFLATPLVAAQEMSLPEKSRFARCSLHVVGIPSNYRDGEAVVEVKPIGSPIVLVLSAGNNVQWTVNVHQDADVRQVIVIGSSEQKLAVPLADTPVFYHSQPEENDKYRKTIAPDWHSMAGPGFRALLHQMTGLKPATYQTRGRPPLGVIYRILTVKDEEESQGEEQRREPGIGNTDKDRHKQLSRNMRDLSLKLKQQQRAETSQEMERHHFIVDGRHGDVKVLDSELLTLLSDRRMGEIRMLVDSVGILPSFPASSRMSNFFLRPKLDRLKAHKSYLKHLASRCEQKLEDLKKTNAAPDLQSHLSQRLQFINTALAVEKKWSDAVAKSDLAATIGLDRTSLLDCQLHVVTCQQKKEADATKSVRIEVRPTEQPMLIALFSAEDIEWDIHVAPDVDVRQIVVVGGEHEPKVSVSTPGVPLKKIFHAGRSRPFPGDRTDKFHKALAPRLVQLMQRHGYEDRADACLKVIELTGLHFATIQGNTKHDQPRGKFVIDGRQGAVTWEASDVWMLVNNTFVSGLAGISEKVTTLFRTASVFPTGGQEDLKSRYATRKELARLLQLVRAEKKQIEPLIRLLSSALNHVKATATATDAEAELLNRISALRELLQAANQFDETLHAGHLPGMGSISSSHANFVFSRAAAGVTTSIDADVVRRYLRSEIVQATGQFDYYAARNLRSHPVAKKIQQRLDSLEQTLKLIDAQQTLVPRNDPKASGTIHAQRNPQGYGLLFDVPLSNRVVTIFTQQQREIFFRLSPGTRVNVFIESGQADNHSPNIMLPEIPVLAVSREQHQGFPGNTAHAVSLAVNPEQERQLRAGLADGQVILTSTGSTARYTLRVPSSLCAVHVETMTPFLRRNGCLSASALEMLSIEPIAGTKMREVLADRQRLLTDSLQDSMQTMKNAAAAKQHLLSVKDASAEDLRRLNEQLHDAATRTFELRTRLQSCRMQLAAADLAVADEQRVLRQKQRSEIIDQRLEAVIRGENPGFTDPSAEGSETHREEHD